MEKLSKLLKFKQTTIVEMPLIGGNNQIPVFKSYVTWFNNQDKKTHIET